MRFFNLEQGSKEWENWRKKGIGASETPIIMGISPFATPLQLYNAKKGLADPSGETLVTKKGNLMEPTARMFYENHTGIEMRPVTVAHDDLNFMIASLDGWNDAYKMLVEIKFPGKKDWDLAQKGEVPSYYYYQIQHQMIVTGTSKAHYYAFKGEYGRLIVVQADRVVQDQIIAAAKHFMDRLRLNQPPPLSDRDIKYINDDDDLTEKVALYRKLQSQIKMDKETLKALEKDIALKCNHSKCSIDGLRVIKYSRKGSIDWDQVKALPQLKSLDLERYRKQSIDIIQFREEKKGDENAS